MDQGNPAAASRCVFLQRAIRSCSRSYWRVSAASPRRGQGMTENLGSREKERIYSDACGAALL